jgi:hypothetical protein
MTMDAQQKASLKAQAKQLRIELKTFETNWAKDNGGKKPGRDDIKQSGDMGMTQPSTRLREIC